MPSQGMHSIVVVGGIMVLYVLRKGAGQGMMSRRYDGVIVALYIRKIIMLTGAIVLLYCT